MTEFSDDGASETGAPTNEAHWRALLADGQITIFAQREAETLQKLAAFFDPAHDDDLNFRSLKEFVRLWQTLSGLGALGRAIMTAVIACAAFIAAITALTGRYQWVADLFQHAPVTK